MFPDYDFALREANRWVLYYNKILLFLIIPFIKYARTYKFSKSLFVILFIIHKFIINNKI